MSDNQTWHISFPAVTPESQQIFLNNRGSTQVPKSITQGIVDALHKGIVSKNNARAANVRQKLVTFLHGNTPDRFFFTESEAGVIHWLAYSWGFSQLQDGDEVVLSSQDAPMIRQTWNHVREQMARQGISLLIKEFGYQENGEFDLKELLSQVSPKTRLIFVPHIHPVFGTKNEDDIAFLKQQVGDQALIAVDLSQSVGRIPVNLEHLRCDCAFFSGRNLFSPFHFGIGYLPHSLYKDQDTFLTQEPVNSLAARALAQGIDLLEQTGMQRIALHLQELSHYLLTRLQQIDSLEFLPGIGRCEEWCSPGYGILSFRLPGVSAEECAMLLAENALFVDLAYTPIYQDAVIVSLHLYNTIQHIDALVDCLQQLCM